MIKVKKKLLTPTGITWIGIGIMTLIIVGYIVYTVFIFVKTPNTYVGV